VNEGKSWIKHRIHKINGDPYIDLYIIYKLEQMTRWLKKHNKWMVFKHLFVKNMMIKRERQRQRNNWYKTQKRGKVQKLPEAAANLLRWKNCFKV